MAKKKVEEQSVSVEEKLSNLYQLQSVMSEIDRLRTIRGELPEEVQELEDEIEGRKTRKKKYEADVAQLKKYISDRKNAIQKSQELIAKYSKQLDSVRNNREYDALTKEVEFQNLEIQFCEKKIAEDQLSIKRINEDIENLEEETSGRMIDLETKRKELDEIILETKQDEEKLRKTAKALEDKIEDRLLVAFKRTRKAARNGLSVVTIEREACNGCFNKIPPQRQLDVKLHKKIIVCEYCGRILVDPEMAEAIDSKKKK